MSDKVTNEAVTEKLKIVPRALKLPQQTPRAKTLSETLEKRDRPPPGCRGAARLVVSELRPTTALLLVLLRLTGNHGADPLNRPILNQALGSRNFVRILLASWLRSQLWSNCVWLKVFKVAKMQCGDHVDHVETMSTIWRQTPFAWIQPSGLAFGEKRERMWDRQNLRDQTSYKYSQ